jgi:hypothetical protein
VGCWREPSSKVPVTCGCTLSPSLPITSTRWCGRGSFHVASLEFFDTLRGTAPQVLLLLIM